MNQVNHYKVAPTLQMVCTYLNVSAERVLQRAGLPIDYIDTETRGVDGSTYFALWRAVAVEHKNPNLALEMGNLATKGTLQPALLSFSASPDVETGLTRLAVFKPLVCPLRFSFEKTADSFTVHCFSGISEDIPEFFAATEIIFMLELIRNLTAFHVKPLEVALPSNRFVNDAYQSFLDAPVTLSDTLSIKFSIEDVKRPLITADTEFYKVIEAELTSRLNLTMGANATTDRVRRTLTQLLPSGVVSTDQISEKLGLSKRTLQRKLKEEGTSFQAVLDETRASLALTYLRDQKLSAEETSFLLAYRDPSSFYRAFQEWTGMTPAQARETHIA